MSSWPWRFILSLTEEEKQRRRELLDLRGYYAQGTAVAVILLLRCYQLYSQTKLSATQGVEKRAAARRQPRSWWNSPLFPGGMETRKQYLVTGLWLGWLLGLSVWRSGDDYLHFTKALGHVGLSQLPLQVLMAPASYIDTARPIAPSAVSVLTGLPQSTLTPYHRLVGRLVMAPLLVGHAVLYAFFFLQTPHPAFGTLLSKRIRDLDVQLGLAAAVATILVLLVARPTSQTRGFSFGGATVKTRRQVFYLVHVSLVMVLEAAAYFHVSHAQLFVLESFAASAINMVLMGVNRLG